MLHYFKIWIFQAFKDTHGFWGWDIKSIIVPPIFFFSGLFYHANKYGLEAAQEELKVWVSFALIPVGGFFIMLFLFKFFAAPYKIYNANKQELNKELDKLRQENTQTKKDLHKEKKKSYSLPHELTASHIKNKTGSSPKRVGRYWPVRG